MKNKNLVSLCESAIMVALAAVLSFFKIKLWGNGGSVDLVMVPLIVLGWRRGWKWSIPSGLAFGFIKCLISEALGYGLISVLFDYVLAYGLVGFAGFFKNEKYGLVLGTLAASLLRFAAHFVSGITVWRLAVGENVELFGNSYSGDTAVLYSLIYNGSYMLFNMLAALLLVVILRRALLKIPK